MKREIKFRVFDKISNQMHLWDVIKNTSTNNFYLEHYELMQYIGRKDKMGKGIYEGDIIEYVDWDNVAEDEFINKGIISWDSINIGFTISNRNFVDIDDVEFEKNALVIANIYENPNFFDD